MQSVSIAGRRIGPGERVFIIAEMSANHCQDLERARTIIREAAACGADAVKVQCYTAETMTIDCPKEDFVIRGTIWDGQTLHDLYAGAYMPWEWVPELEQLAAELGIILFSTVYDQTAVDYLEQRRHPAYKVGSFELVDIPLLERIAKTGKPVILSAGMSTPWEIREAMVVLRGVPVVLLHCNSAYPAPTKEMNLGTITRLHTEFGVPVGLSDHSRGLTAAITAVGMGAQVIEKHLMVEPPSGPDSNFSMLPPQFAELVQAVREARLCRAHNWIMGPTPSEQPSARLRRSLYVVKGVKQGERFTIENVRSIRPSYGLHPRMLLHVLGCSATRDIERGTPLAEGMWQ